MCFILAQEHPNDYKNTRTLQFPFNGDGKKKEKILLLKNEEKTLRVLALFHPAAQEPRDTTRDLSKTVVHIHGKYGCHIHGAP